MAIGLKASMTNDAAIAHPCIDDNFINGFPSGFAVTHKAIKYRKNLIIIGDIQSFDRDFDRILAFNVLL